jgi:hypothetical protein
MAEVIGKSITPWPGRFLEALVHAQGDAALPLALPAILTGLGSPYVDRPAASAIELRARQGALRSVTDPGLEKTRSTCLKILEDTLKSLSLPGSDGQSAAAAVSDGHG